MTLTVDAAANRATYTSGGIQFSGFFYRPAGNGPFPAVLLLHGGGGLREAQRTYASFLATQGYVAFAPDYLTPVGKAGGLNRAGGWGRTDWETSIDPVRNHQGMGLESLKSLSYVDSKRIGVLGFSLGGYFGFILVTRDDVKGIVSYYGAYNGKPITPNPNRYAFSDVVAQIKVPVLMFHGDTDELVPVSFANRTQDLFMSSGKQSDYIVYQGVGHSFDDKGTPAFNAKAAADAQQKTLAFLNAKLRGP